MAGACGGGYTGSWGGTQTVGPVGSSKVAAGERETGGLPGNVLRRRDELEKERRELGWISRHLTLPRRGSLRAPEREAPFGHSRHPRGTMKGAEGERSPKRRGRKRARDPADRGDSGGCVLGGAR